MKADFHTCVGIVLGHEGGYVLDPKDPGGETNMGISKRAFPREDIRNMTRERAEHLYVMHYWLPAKCDQVAPAARPLYFDTAVNCGPVMAIRLLQLSLGLPSDGIFGPNTALAAKNADRKALAVERMKYYSRIMDRNPVLRRFMRGWTNRVNSYLQ